ncbi:MAG: RibD family protein, partial [Myxococcota bacterium]
MGRGLRPPDGAALIGAPFWAEARETGWSADRLLSKTSIKNGLALAFEPDAERWTALQASNVHEIWLAGLHPHHDQRGAFIEAVQNIGRVVRWVDVPAARALAAPYIHARASGRAFVVLKAATSIDGRSASRTGQSQWITGPVARAVGRRVRSQVDAILVGIGTVLADDPQLTARRFGRPDPVRIVLDTQLRIPLDVRLVTTARQ